MSPTHKGWFLFAPVYLDMTDPENPGMWARWELLEPLIDVAHWIQVSVISFLSYCDPDYEPAFMIRVTGELGA